MSDQAGTRFFVEDGTLRDQHIYNNSWDGEDKNIIAKDCMDAIALILNRQEVIMETLATIQKKIEDGVNIKGVAQSRSSW